MWLGGDGEDARLGLSGGDEFVRERHGLSGYSGAVGTAEVIARLHADELRNLEGRGRAPARSRPCTRWAGRRCLLAAHVARAPTRGCDDDVSRPPEPFRTLEIRMTNWTKTRRRGHEKPLRIVDLRPQAEEKFVHLV